MFFKNSFKLIAKLSGKFRDLFYKTTFPNLHMLTETENEIKQEREKRGWEREERKREYKEGGEGDEGKRERPCQHQHSPSLWH